MKSGKTVNLKLDNRFKIVYGTIDSADLKSCYITMSTWATPLVDNNMWERKISLFRRNIITSLIEYKSDLFKMSKALVDLDIRSSGVMLNKKSFMRYETTLFLAKKIDIKSERMRSEITNIIYNIINSHFNDNSLFTFTKIKN